MKRSIAWHEDNLKNSKIYYESILKKIEGLQYELNKIKGSNDLLQRQILEAKIQKKDSFDRDKFLKRKIK